LDADEIAKNLYRASGQADTVSGTVTPAVDGFGGWGEGRKPLQRKGLE
jgi:hypothetical protein